MTPHSKNSGAPASAEPVSSTATAPASDRRTYAELDLPAELHRALVDMKFVHPTPIQEKAIPVALTGQDIIGCAATGTGKTAAFLIPLLTKLIDEPEATALVLLPTRELALQVGEVYDGLTKYLRGMTSATLIGGVAMGNQLKALARRPRLIVATPGRLLDHLGRNSVSLKKLGFLVLDEADRMLDMGFQPQLREILRYLPHERQTMLFSATLPANILELSAKYLVDPARVDIKGPPTLDGEPAELQKLNIAESTVQVEQKEKNVALLDELNAREGSVLVFARTQSRVDRICRYLETYDISVARIHGGRTQGQRVRALDGFRDGSTRVLIATDLASRGIDIDHVAHVINFDLPQAPEDYVHRIGRTGRAGRSGEAVSFVTREDAPMWRAIERLKSGVASVGPPGSQSPRSGGGGRSSSGRGGAGGGRTSGGRSGNSRGSSGRRPEGRSDGRSDGRNENRASGRSASPRGEGDRSDRPPNDRSRSEGGRSEGGRSEGGRSEGGRSEGGRSEGGRSEGGRSEGGRSEGGRSEGGRSEGGRSEGNRNVGYRNEGSSRSRDDRGDSRGPGTRDSERAPRSSGRPESRTESRRSDSENRAPARPHFSDRASSSGRASETRGSERGSERGTGRDSSARNSERGSSRASGEREENRREPAKGPIRASNRPFK